MGKDIVPTVINIHLRKVGATFYASSPQLPGLHVCGKSEDAVIADVPPIVQHLLEAKLGSRVNVMVPPGPDFKPTKRVQRYDGWANLLAFQGSALAAQ